MSNEKTTDGPYKIEPSGDTSFGFMGYIVVGPGIVNEGDDMEHGVAKKQCLRLNAAYAAGFDDGAKLAIDTEGHRP